jgi:phosphoglucosamine mutase
VGRLFGTDGVRGTANREVTAELALDLAVAAAHVLGEVGEFAGHRPRAVVPRASSSPPPSSPVWPAPGST